MDMQEMRDRGVLAVAYRTLSEHQVDLARLFGGESPAHLLLDAMMRASAGTGFEITDLLAETLVACIRGAMTGIQASARIYSERFCRSLGAALWALEERLNRPFSHIHPHFNPEPLAGDTLAERVDAILHGNTAPTTATEARTRALVPGTDAAMPVMPDWFYTRLTELMTDADIDGDAGDALHGDTFDRAVNEAGRSVTVIRSFVHLRNLMDDELHEEAYWAVERRPEIAEIADDISFIVQGLPDRWMKVALLSCMVLVSLKAKMPFGFVLPLVSQWASLYFLEHHDAVAEPIVDQVCDMIRAVNQAVAGNLAAIRQLHGTLVLMSNNPVIHLSIMAAVNRGLQEVGDRIRAHGVNPTTPDPVQLPRARMNDLSVGSTFTNTSTGDVRYWSGAEWVASLDEAIRLHNEATARRSVDTGPTFVVPTPPDGERGFFDNFFTNVTRWSNGRPSPPANGGVQVEISAVELPQIDEAAAAQAAAEVGL